MVDQQQVKAAGQRVAEAATWVRAMEMMQDAPIKLVAEYISPGNVKSNIKQLQSEFSWIPARFESYGGIDSGGNGSLVSYFDGIVRSEFGVEREADNPFADMEDTAEIFQLGSTIVPYFNALSNAIAESRGDAFESFRDNFVNKLSDMLANQAALAIFLSESAAFAEHMYEAARNDLMIVSNEAIDAFNILASRMVNGNSGFMSGWGDALGIGGTAATLLGLYPPLSATMGVLSLVAGVLGNFQEDATGYLRRAGAIDGDSIQEVSASLERKLDSITDHLRATEQLFIWILKTVNEALRVGMIDEVVAPGMAPR